MGKKNRTFRNIALLVIFVMLIICSILSVSYAYYASTANNNNSFVVHNTTVECLSISTSSGAYIMASSLPSYFYPVSDTYARTTAGNAPSHGTGTSTDLQYTGRAFGQLSMEIKNNCTNSVYVDVLFVPTFLNQIDLSFIRYALCFGEFGPASTCWLATSNAYSAAKTLGNSATGQLASCFGYTSGSFWNYVARNAMYNPMPLNQNMCSFIKQNYTPGLTISGNGTTKLTIRYWLNEGTSVNYYDGRLLSGHFYVYGF